MACSCPIDWMLCTSRQCPRGALLAEQSQAMHQAAMEFMGDPFKPVGGIAADPNPHILQQLIDRGRAE